MQIHTIGIDLGKGTIDWRPKWAHFAKKMEEANDR